MMNSLTKPNVKVLDNKIKPNVYKNIKPGEWLFRVPVSEYICLKLYYKLETGQYDYSEERMTYLTYFP